MSRAVAWWFGAVLALASPAHAQFVNGDLYVADYFGNAIYRVEPGTWKVSLFADWYTGLRGVSTIAALRVRSSFNFQS